MKKIVLLFCLLILHKTIMIGQNKPHPPISPEAAFTQQFGQNEIQVQYARPSSRGRKVFGSLVPYDTIWRTGAGDCTTFFVNGPIEIAGQNLDSGKYSLFTIPGENTWTIILNKDNTMHGTSQYNQEHDVMRFRVIPGKSNNYYETFTIDINEFTASGSAKLILSWENTQVKISLNNPAYNKTDTGRIDTSTPGKRMTEHVEAIKETEAEKNSKNNSESKTSEKTASNIKTQFAPLLNEYYALKDALVQDNSKISAEKAKGLKNKT
ncbi:MAG TPA: DUF2911 domain-containing protein, partial [Bacteroidia bacterium]|nr:DUF2911 domain-containing protein [Bacteroidia bacterium]